MRKEVRDDFVVTESEASQESANEVLRGVLETLRNSVRYKLTAIAFVFAFASGGTLFSCKIEDGTAEIENNKLILISYTFDEGHLRVTFQPVAFDTTIKIIPNFGEPFEATISADGLLDIAIHNRVTEVIFELDNSILTLKREVLAGLFKIQ